MHRRAALRRVAGFAGAAALGKSVPGDEPEVEVAGRLKQSVACWSFCGPESRLSLRDLCRIAKGAGCLSVELACSRAELETIKESGLSCAIVGLDTGPEAPYIKGFNNPIHWSKLFEQTRQAIDLAAEFGCPNVIAFTGSETRNPSDPSSPRISLEEGFRNCVEGLQCMADYAERKKVTLNLESLNTRERDDSFRGFPGYQGAHIDYCLDIVEKVDSPFVKLLFDVYHVQVMDGDVVRRMRKSIDSIGHVQVAGSPGRGEPCDEQEIAYRPIMKALAELQYQGYVGHEFIPTEDPEKAIQRAVEACRV